MSESLRYAVLASSSILLICLGCCVPCASRFISFVELISISIEKQRFEVKKWPGGIRGRMAMRERPELCYQP
ncbi:hypothetical protein [Nitrosomonas sp. sh817]|uniref:hypothetical protein n=1 Tax=Nitrosomonas sp. sh817 TaxID=3070658 RepID=UPI0027DB075C|nr:hypothetical protein [Nitrosomonas sp. sh817]WMJ07673.1 hypothetical protein RBH92_09535 [Nitrosomonas sp. sh817]